MSIISGAGAEPAVGPTKSITTGTIKEAAAASTAQVDDPAEEPPVATAPIADVPIELELEGDENADEIELRVDEMKTPKSNDGASSEAGKEAIKRLFKVNSKEEKGKKGKGGKGKTKSNSELSTAEALPATEAGDKAKKSSSNRSINRNNSGGAKAAGYNIFNFLFPTDK